ncbi:MAG: hypothetical protein GXO83_06685 [Chlorobi bacterium]|nr:hypothetical protein [Chlorobiota bacterium]
MHRGAINNYVVFDDDGYEINIILIEKATLFMTRIHDDDLREEIKFNLILADQQGNNEFLCYAYSTQES